MKIVSSEFIKGAANASQYPATKGAEFAFFGRSNAGKSSLINMLLNRKSLVKTGSRPGMTRIINFFAVNGGEVTLVDLPGYGFAQRSADENSAFDRMLAEYASSRAQLRTIFFLMDMRREPGDVEKESIEYFERLNVEVVIVGTKADKLSKNDIYNATRKWATMFNRAPELIAVTSASKNTGRDQLLKMITERAK
ncbi:MAG TPA: ribosome biogenesis GTP-binding protein YihA/YsxC [Treponemataceae bacterium]|nr:ribosome biogenesis GTP-binding protein YihA/YsxC [Treponemataceae bacterium]